MYQPLASNEERQGSPPSLPAWWQQFKVFRYMWFGKTEVAIDYLVQTLKEDSPKLRLPEVRFLIKNQALQEAREYLEKFDTENEHQADILYLLACCYLGQGLVQEAKTKVEKALEMQPEKAAYWDNLADCLLEQGDWRAATVALDKSLRSAPTKAETLYRLGSIFAYHEEYLEALRCFQGCCELSPRNPVYWELKAETHLHLGQIEQACQSFEKSLRHSVNLEVATRLAYCYIQLQNIKKGIRYYEIVLKHEPDNYDALCNLAAVYQNQDRSMEALNLLERAQNLYPHDPILTNNLAYTLVQLGRTRKATEQYYTALRLAPDNPLILYNLSVCLVRRGNWEDGVQTLQKLLEIDPEHSAGWALLGNIYEHLTQYDIATDCFNRALKLA